MQRTLGAEFLGTFVLVLGGCGSAMYAATIADVGIGFLGVALAFGLTVLIMAFAVGHISGGHFNPAVTLGLVAGGRFEAKEAPGYIGAQVVAAILAVGVLYVIATGNPGFDRDTSTFAANGYGAHSPEGYSLAAAFLTETVFTAVFLLVIMGATSKRAPAGFAPIAIGLALTLIHLVTIPVTNTSVNPARSTGPAIFVADSWAISQLWLFWLAPLLGGVLGGAIYRFILEGPDESTPMDDAGLVIEATGPQSEGALRVGRRDADSESDE
jgi:aquaporin Z